MQLFYRFVLVGLLAFQFSQAGVYMKQKHHTDAMEVMGQTQPAEDVIEEIRMDERGFRSDNPDRSMIFNARINTMIIADHGKKTVLEIPLGQNLFSGMMEGQNGEEAKAMQEMMQNMMKMEITIVPSGEKKSINSWPCEKYTMTLIMAMGQISAEIWATEALKIDPDLYSKFTSGMMAMMPGVQQNLFRVKKEFEKIKGVQVINRTSSQVMGQTVNAMTELIEFREAMIPAGLFEIPAGYKKQSFMDQ
jgi:hypothetical protein